ncbi:hypothetical protein [Streptomyces sp. NPDC094032]|uniref:hypothetical protein n=1 Tax=Streptomyces sp. NPDC094032 TaxID=3155308 RepID=UPI003334707E
MNARAVKRTGAAVLALQAGYLLLMHLAFAIFAGETGEPRPAGGPDLRYLALMAAVLLVLLASAAVLALPALAGRTPWWVRAPLLAGAVVLQLYVIMSALSNAGDQGFEPDSVLNVVMTLLALVAAAASVLGLRGVPAATAATE